MSIMFRLPILPSAATGGGLFKCSENCSSIIFAWHWNFRITAYSLSKCHKKHATNWRMSHEITNTEAMGRRLCWYCSTIFVSKPDLDHVVAHGPREDYVGQQPGVVSGAQTHLNEWIVIQFKAQLLQYIAEYDNPAVNYEITRNVIIIWHDTCTCSLNKTIRCLRYKAPWMWNVDEVVQVSIGIIV